MSEFVSVLGLCFRYIVDWLLEFVGLYNSYAIFTAVVALIVLGLVIDLFQYIIPKR